MKKQARKFASIAAAALIALSVSVLPAANENAALPSAAITVSAASSAPKAPSKDYTGFSKEGSDTYFFENGKLKKGGLFTYEGKKYYANKDGTLLRNDWKKMKSGKYYYADNKCVVTTYEFKELVTHEEFDKTINGLKYYHDEKYLIINGKPAKAEDVPIKSFGILKIGHDYYTCYSRKETIWDGEYDYVQQYASVEVHPKLYVDTSEMDVYDLGTKKKIAEFVYKAYEPVHCSFGDISYEEKHPCTKHEKTYVVSSKCGCINSGKLFDKKNNKILTFRGKGKEPTVSDAGKIIVYGGEFESNSLGGVSPALGYYNNTGKEIKYINFNVSFYNRVGDVCADEHSKATVFTLNAMGPIANKTTLNSSWDVVMYNNYASEMKIVSVQVDFMDGTSKTYKGKDLSVLW